MISKSPQKIQRNQRFSVLEPYAILPSHARRPPSSPSRQRNHRSNRMRNSYASTGSYRSLNSSMRSSRPSTRSSSVRYSHYSDKYDEDMDQMYQQGYEDGLRARDEDDAKELNHPRYPASLDNPEDVDGGERWSEGADDEFYSDSHCRHRSYTHEDDVASPHDASQVSEEGLQTPEEEEDEAKEKEISKREQEEEQKRIQREEAEKLRLERESKCHNLSVKFWTAWW